jgi:hypothetical protein
MATPSPPTRFVALDIHRKYLVLPLSVVDKSDFFPSRLTVHFDPLYDQKALPVSHFK